MLFIPLWLQVRDRATLYLNTLGGDGSVVETEGEVKEFLFGSFDVPLANMETSLKNYVSLRLSFLSYAHGWWLSDVISLLFLWQIQDPSEESFDINSVPKEVKSQPLAEKKAPGKKPTGLGAPPSAPPSAADAYEKLLLSIPEFASFGKLFKVIICDFCYIDLFIVIN